MKPTAGHAAIYLESTAEGQLAFKIEYTGGLRQDCGAHRMANEVRKFIESRCPKVEGSEKVTVGAPAGPNGEPPTIIHPPGNWRGKAKGRS